MTACPCRCHGQSSSFGSCSVAGGCGHLHQRPDVDEPSMLCYRGPDCADVRKRTNTNPDGTTTRVRIPARATGPGLLCRMDTTITRVAIEQLPMDYVELTTILGKTNTVEVATAHSRGLPAPIQLGIAVLAEAIVDELERWAEVVAADAGFWFHPAGGLGERILTATGWIAGRFDRLLAVPASWHQRLNPSDPLVSGKDSSTYALESGLDGALKLLKLHELTTEMSGRIRRAERLHSPCPRCQRLALEHDEGSSHVDCRRCGHRMPLEDYDELASTLAKAYESSPRQRPEAVRSAPERTVAETVMWADRSEHTRCDAGSNMMLTYLERIDQRAGAVA